MKKLVGFGVFYCPMCSTRLNSGSAVCPSCGADTDAKNLFDRWPVVDGGKALARRRKAAYRFKEVVYKLLFGALLAWGVPRVLFATGQLSHNDEGRLVSTVLDAMFMGIAVLYSLLGLAGKLKTFSYSVSAGQKACRVCGTPNDARSMYCIKCGCELPAPVPARRAKAPAAAPAREKPRAAFCAGCGARLREGARFCLWYSAKNSRQHRTKKPAFTQVRSVW